MKKTILGLFLFLFLCNVALSQVRSITGVVTSADDGQALPGVTVQIKGTTTGTVTDLDGKFKLSEVGTETVVVISFVGFEPKEITVGDQVYISIQMSVSAEQLEEFVVTALGIKRQQREIGYSTEKIDADVVIESKAQNVISAITGRSAGVQVSQADGVEGGSTRIIIRGNNNIGNDKDNQPLIVVDNIPIENNPGLTDIGRGVDWGSAINDLNAYDIESMTVMKGGAASALYGSRGANGVVFITTKRGNKQKGIGVTYNFDYKITEPYRYREVQNTYGHGGPISFTPPTFPMSGDTLLYPGIYGNENLIINQEGETSSTSAEFGYYGSAVSWGPKMEGQMVKWWDGEMRDYSPQPDNMEMPYHTGYTTTHHISATGGGEKGTMRVSITRQDNKPIVENSNFDRTTINVGANLKVSEKVRADVSMSYVNFNRLKSPMLGEDWSSFNKGFLYSWPRSYKGIDKEYYEYPDGSQNPQEGYPFYYISPTLWWGYYNNNTTLTRDKYIGALTLTYDITSWLNVMGRIGRDFTTEQYETKNKPIDVIGLEDGYYANSLSKNIGDNYDFILTAYKEKILKSKFDLKFTAGASRWNKDDYVINGHSGIWYYPNMYTFFNYTENTYYTDANNNTVVQTFGNSAGSMVTGEGIMRKRINSIYSFINLSYSNYVFLELTGRNDWSSTLPPENNSYFYPSLSLSFIASEAFRFQERLPWMNFLKIKGGIAQTATDTKPYLNTFYYNTSQFGGEQTSNFPSTIPPIELKPQRVNAYEGGINLGFLENKIDLDFTYYYLYSFDQIIPNLPIPASSGANNIMTNEGILTNQGFEIIFNALIFRTVFN